MSLELSSCDCRRAKPKPFSRDASVMKTVSAERSKWARTGGDTRAALVASNAASWSGF